MNMQSDIGELVRGGKEFNNERRHLGLPSRFGCQGARESLNAKLSQKTEGSSTSSTGLRTRPETVDNMEDEEVIFEMEKGPKQQIKVEGSAGNVRQPPLPQPYCGRRMRITQTAQVGTQTMSAKLITKMEGLNLSQQLEMEMQQEILDRETRRLRRVAYVEAGRGSLLQEQLKKQLEECFRKRRQELATATNADGGTSCRGPTALR
jgi:hypothetical protein